MYNQKIIKQIDIRCNIAFIDIIQDTTAIYVISCTGENYTNYPCYGNEKFGFTEHSSICRAAVTAGIQCGMQCLVFYIGEKCNFPSTCRNGVKTSFYSDWSKAFLIKEVNLILSEHNSMRSEIELSKSLCAKQKEKISDLEFKLENYRFEKENSENKLIALQREKTALKSKNDSFQIENKNLSSKFVKLKKSSFEEIRQIKEKNEKILEAFNRISEEKKNLFEINGKMNSEIQRLQQEKIKNDLVLEEKNNTQKLEKELEINDISSGIDSLLKNLSKITKDFENEKAKIDNEKSNTNAIKDMKEIMDVLTVLKVDLDAEENFDAIPDDVLVDFKNVKNRQNFEKSLNEAKSLIKNNLNEIDKENFEKFQNLIKSFSKIHSQLKGEQIAEFQKIEKKTLSLLNKTLLTPSKSISLKTETAEILEKLDKFNKAHDILKKTERKIEKHTAERNIAEIIKETKSMQSQIKNFILPQSAEIQNFIDKFLGEKNDKIGEKSVEKIGEESVEKIGEKMDFLLDVKKFQKRICEAEDDLVKIEKISPIKENSMEKILKANTEAEQKAKESLAAVKSDWKEIKAAFEKLLQNLQNHKKCKSTLYGLTNEADSLSFKILRWNETKETRIDELKQHIKTQKEWQKYYENLQKSLEAGQACLNEIKRRRGAKLCLEGEAVQKVALSVFKSLFESLLKDFENKKRQISRIKNKRNELNSQLDEALEMMDEEMAIEIKSQIDSLPKREKSLNAKISETQKEIEFLKSNPLYLIYFNQKSSKNDENNDENNNENDEKMVKIDQNSKKIDQKTKENVTKTNKKIDQTLTKKGEKIVNLAKNDENLTKNGENSTKPKIDEKSKENHDISNSNIKKSILGLFNK